MLSESRERSISVADLVDMAEAGLLIFNSLAYVQQQLARAGVSVPNVPSRPDAALIEAKGGELRAAFSQLASAIAVNQVRGIAFAASEAQLALDAIFLACGLGPAKSELLIALHQSRIGEPDARGWPVPPDIDGILDRFGFDAGPHRTAGPIAIEALPGPVIDDVRPPRRPPAGP